MAAWYEQTIRLTHSNGSFKLSHGGNDVLMLYFIQACGKWIKIQLVPTAPLKYCQTSQTSVDLFPIFFFMLL